MLLRAPTIERAAVLAACKEAHEYLQARDEALARRIVSELADWVKRSLRRR